LIGCETDGLSGVGNDLDLMEKTLLPRGFAIRRITGVAASRDGILAAYRELIDAVQPGEPAVVYYSGHGGRVEAPPPETPGPPPMDLQFIAPSDFHDSSPGDFRGITSVELSVLLGQLTARTRNATVILDCCHAAHLSRDRELRVRALSQREQYEVLRDHVERLRRLGDLPTGPLPALGNPDAVRIVACAPEQSAFEYQGESGRQIGILTESLALALVEAGKERVTWTTVVDRVRARVRALCPFQRPEVEGPASRFTFETEQDDGDALSAVTPLDGVRVRIPCAALLGVQIGDVFEIIEPGTVDSPTPTLIGTVRIDRLDSFGAEGPIVFASGRSTVPPNAKARRTVAAQAMAVSLPDPAHPRAAALRHAIDVARELRPARPDESWTVEVRIGADGELTIHDRIGQLPGEYGDDAGGIASVLRSLKALARVSALRSLPGGSPWSLNAALDMEWGTVREGKCEPLPVAGATVHVDEHVYLSVRNSGPEPVYLSLIDIGVSGQITVLTYDSLSGRRLGSGREHVFGSDALGALPGIPVVWPAPLDPTKARPETMLLLVSDAPQDVSVLAQRGVGRASTAPGPGSPLSGLLHRAFGGRDLVLPGPGHDVVRYDALAIDFELDPFHGGEDGFLIEERPPIPPAPSLTSREQAARTVAVRLDELLVHRNHAWRDADIRIDTMVTTALRDTDAGPAYQARTERFSRIRSGEALPLDRMLLHHGPAREFLDLAIWVSRDTPDSPTLGELLAEEAAGFEVRETLAQLLPNLGAVPGATAAVTAAALSAVLVNVGYKLLRRDVATVIGLYRGSMLAHERFGAGRHPVSGARRVQDLSLAFTVDVL
jgi:hypothetical protein